MNIWYACYDNNNFGDHLPKYVIEKITGEKPVFVHPSVDVDEVHVWSGSVLREAKSNWICYGLGFGDYDQTCPVKPKRIDSVRGKLSREKLLQQGIDCPEKYWDICELLPEIFYPDVKKNYRVGYIPHYRDYEEYKHYNSPESLVINILDEPETIVTQVLQCERIVSTSLHGLILSDVYMIPRTWEVSKTLESQYKFHDYLSRYL